jgi:hypothetical protein
MDLGRMAQRPEKSLKVGPRIKHLVVYIYPQYVWEQLHVCMLGAAIFKCYGRLSWMRGLHVAAAAARARRDARITSEDS